MAGLRSVAASEETAWNEIVRDNVHDTGPPPSAIEQLHLLTGLRPNSLNILMIIVR